MRRPILTFRASVYVLFVLASAGCRSCKTQPNPKDTTPPTVTWIVRNQGTGQEWSYAGNATHQARVGESLLITACVEDDGGVKEITSSSSTGYTCSSDGLAQNVGPGLGVIETSPLGLDSEGLAWKKFCKFVSFELLFGCSRGFTFSNGSVGINCAGKNYANLSAGGSLAINVTP